MRNRQRAVALGLAVTAAALVAAGPKSDGPAPARGHPDGATPARAHSSSGEPARRRPAGGQVKVTAPVRIADAATVRLLRPGDRVDVIAVPSAGPTAADGEAWVVARRALVTKVPEPADPSAVTGDGDEGALLVLSVSRSTATRLAGASGSARLAVTLW